LTRPHRIADELAPDVSGTCIARGIAMRWFLAVLLLPAACSPATPYRYSAMTPAARPIPWDGRTAGGGRLHVEGSIADSSVSQNYFPQIHDTALEVPRTTVEGAAHFSPVRGLEFGARFSYAAYDWTTPSAYGTMPLPSHPDLWGVGPEVRASIWLDHAHRFALGVAVNFMHYSIPYAKWQRGGCSLSPTCVNTETPSGDLTYSLVNEGSVDQWTYTVGIYPSVNVGPDQRYGHVFGVLALHTGFKNDGFTDVSTSSSTVEDNGPIPIVGIGYGITVYPVHVSLLNYLPITDRSGVGVNYGPGVMLAIGLDMNLWNARR